MAVTNPSLLQEVQRFNEALNTSNTQEIQNKVSDRLFGLFENRPNIVLNEEFLVELEKTGNLASFAIRIPAIKNKLNQTAIPVNTINITNTVVNLANTNTAKSIQDEINAITNTNIKNLDALPNQITRVREKLNKNRENLIDIRNIQQKIDDINTNRGNNTQTVAQINAQMRTTNTQITACKSVRSIFESITQEEANLITASDKQKGNIEGKILKLRNSLATMLTNQGANLPGTLYQTITQNSNNISTCSNELMAAEQKLANDLVQLQDQSGFATNLQTETVNLQTAIGKLNQQQVPIPQNI